MYGIKPTTCLKCGRILYGVTLGYGRKWECSLCVKDKTDVLHCEQGNKVVAKHLNAGSSSDSAKAHKLLTKGKIYTVDKLWIGRNDSVIYLKEFPNEGFNTVHFDRY